MKTLEPLKNDSEVDEYMNSVHEGFRMSFCESKQCWCIGCCNRGKDRLITKEQWESWKERSLLSGKKAGGQVKTTKEQRDRTRTIASKRDPDWASSLVIEFLDDLDTLEKAYAKLEADKGSNDADYLRLSVRLAAAEELLVRAKSFVFEFTHTGTPNLEPKAERWLSDLAKFRDDKQ